MPGLQEKKILLTRPYEQSQAWAEELRRLGANPFVFPLIDIHGLVLDAEAYGRIAELAQYDYILFTSINGVRYFMDNLNAAQKALLSHKKIAAVGESTANYLLMRGLRPDYTPSTYTSAALAGGLPVKKGSRCLLPTTPAAREELKQLLEERGVQVDEIYVYAAGERTTGAETLKEIMAEEIDVVTFASPSAVQAFYKLNEESRPQAAIACIGPVTAESVRNLGWPVDIMAKKHTMEGLNLAIENYMMQHDK